MSTLQRYNCMDTIATFRLWREFQPLLAKYKYAREAYAERKAVNAPAMYAMLRGILVDVEEVKKLRIQFITECKELERRLDLIVKPMRLGCINMASPSQVIWLLETLGVHVPKSKNYKAKGAKSTDRDTLERIINQDYEIAPVCKIILGWKDRAQMLKVLRPTLYDRDGRMRCMYKVAGTKTTRWSSGMNVWADKRKKNAAGERLSSGMNMQNIKRDEDEELTGHASIRSAFVADLQKKFCNVDLERADSYGVALEVFKATGDKKYLEACKSRDLHTFTSMLMWPNLPWKGTPQNITDEDIAIAKTFFYRQYDHRFMSKKLNHGAPYLGKPRTLAIQMKIPIEVCERGFRGFFGEFPAIRKWHTIKARQLQTKGYLINIHGTRRNFHSRLDDDATLRAAIGWLGQSSTAGSINRSLLRLFAVQLQMPEEELEFLAQVHDSVLEQFPEANEAQVLELMRAVMPVPITVTSPQGETITVSIPLEFSVGWNWAARSPANPDGLIKLKPGQTDDRTRQRQPTTKTTRLMDRRLSSLY